MCSNVHTLFCTRKPGGPGHCGDNAVLDTSTLFCTRRPGGPGHCGDNAVLDTSTLFCTRKPGGPGHYGDNAVLDTSTLFCTRKPGGPGHCGDSCVAVSTHSSVRGDQSAQGDQSGRVITEIGLFKKINVLFCTRTLGPQGHHRGNPCLWAWLVCNPVATRTMCAVQSVATPLFTPLGPWHRTRRRCTPSGTSRSRSPSPATRATP